MTTTSYTVLLPMPHPGVLFLPLFSGKVAAGFPSPADDYVEKSLDLNELLVQKPAATFFVRAQGESMLGAGIQPNDHEDASITPENERYCAGGGRARSI
jgi:DNA polymerase V